MPWQMVGLCFHPLQQPVPDILHTIPSEGNWSLASSARGIEKKVFATSVVTYQVYFLASGSCKSCSMPGTTAANAAATSFKALMSC